MTGESDNDTAVMKFRQKLNSSESYFNPQPIPKNESDKEAHIKCSDIEGAKKYCPTRWAALERWFAESRKVTCTSFFRLNEEHFSFHLQYKHSSTFANHKYKELSYSKKSKCATPF